MSAIPESVLAIAESLGLTLVLTDPPEDAYQYNPKTRVVYAPQVSCLVHEIAHYLVATPWERKHPNFHLGTGPDGGRASSDLQGPRNQYREEEASLLGILIERELKLSAAAYGRATKFPVPRDRLYTQTWEDHSWSHCRYNARVVLRRLAKLGMVQRLPGGRYAPVMSPRRDGRAANS